MATITILGAGMMGTAFAWPLVDRGHAVRLVGTHLDAAIITSVRERGRHPKLDLDVPAGVVAYPLEQLGDAMTNTDALVLGVSSAGVRWAGERIAPWVRPGLPLAMIAKGLEWNGRTLRTLPDVLLDTLGAAPGIEPVAVAGPCIAGELARRIPTAAVLTARSRAAAEAWADLARAPYYHLWRSDDLVGVELCAALKNAYAMGLAIPAGQHTRAGGTPGSLALHNIEAALFAQSVFEMQRLIALTAGRPQSAAWLPGVGDLHVTCNGGRTGRFGTLLGQGLSPAEAQARMPGTTLECLEILRVLREAVTALTATAELAPTELPLLRHLAEIALDGAPVEWPFSQFFEGCPNSRVLGPSE